MQQSRVTEIRDEVGVRNSSMPYKTECQKRKKKKEAKTQLQTWQTFLGCFLHNHLRQYPEGVGCRTHFNVKKKKKKKQFPLFRCTVVAFVVN